MLVRRTRVFKAELGFERACAIYPDMLRQRALSPSHRQSSDHLGATLSSRTPVFLAVTSLAAISSAFTSAESSRGAARSEPTYTGSWAFTMISCKRTSRLALNGPTWPLLLLGNTMRQAATVPAMTRRVTREGPSNPEKPSIAWPVCCNGFRPGFPQGLSVFQ